MPYPRFYHRYLSFICAATTVCPTLGFTTGNETALRAAIFTGYDHNVRPTAITNVYMSFLPTSLKAIVSSSLLHGANITVATFFSCCFYFVQYSLVVGSAVIFSGIVFVTTRRLNICAHV